MTDKELADAVVALDWYIPDGWYARFGKKDGKWFAADDMGIAPLISAEQFVRDWRVAGALMERCPRIEIRQEHDGRWSVDVFGPSSSAYSWNDSLPRAFTEACVGALEGER